MPSLLDAASSMIGNLPKAMLFVKKFTGKDSNMGQAEKKKVNDDVAALRGLVKKKGKQSSAQKLMGQVASSVGADAELEEVETTKEQILAAMDEKAYVAMEVQFNPGKLSMTTAGGRSVDYRSIGDSARRQLTTVDLTAATTLHVQLVFDQVNIQDAFLHEGNLLTNPTVGNLVSQTQSLVVNARDGYSVQDMADGLLSLLVFHQTRQVIFYWSELYFHGLLTDVSVQYTMFNKLGNPIRALCDLTIRQADSDDLYKSDNDYWDAAFNAAFGEAGFSTTTQSVGALERNLGGWF